MAEGARAGDTGNTHQNPSRSILNRPPTEKFNFYQYYQQVNLRKRASQSLELR